MCHYIILKNHICSCHHQPHQTTKSVNIMQAVKLLRAATNFQNFNFHLKAQNLSSWYCQVFLWNDRLTSIIFEKMFSKYQNLKNHSFSVVLSNKNAVLWLNDLGMETCIPLLPPDWCVFKFCCMFFSLLLFFFLFILEIQ